MKIHKLSRKTKVNQETVRMYRKLGLLKPERNAGNGYYIYSEADFHSLMFIRKLRGANMSLQTIAQFFEISSLTEILDNVEQEMSNTEQQIALLEERLDILKRSHCHLIDCADKRHPVKLITVQDCKYDLLDFQDSGEPRLEAWLARPELSTLSICISKDVLSREISDESLPVKTAIGTYANIIRHHALPVFDPMSVCPAGQYLSTIVELDSLTRIPARLLHPLQQYAAEHHYRFTSNTTAFLIRIDRSAPTTRYIFRLRAQAERI